MASNQLKNKNNAQKKTNPTAPSSKKAITRNDLLDTLNNFFTRNKKVVFYLGMGAAVLFSLLLFDPKVSVGGDDSAYISRAYDVVHGFTFPGFQGPLYPFSLSFFVWIFGINLVVLKLFSMACILVSMYFFYKAFSGIMPQTVVAISFILLSINSSLLYYSSQTYSEAFYLLIQSIFFWVFVKKFYSPDGQKISIGNYLLLGLMIFLLMITRNIAFVAIATVLGYFIINKEWKNVIMSFGGFLVCYILFELIKRMVWGNTGIQVSTQASAILYKNFYNPSLGNEDLVGLINRFFDNSNLFFSKHIYNFLGFRMESTETITVLTIFTWSIILFAFYWGIRKNKILQLVCIYTIIMCSISFLALQKEWSQSRMIIIYLPFFLLMFFSFLYFSTKTKKFSAFQFMVPLIAIVLFFSSFSLTIKNVNQQKNILSHNLDGNMLYGLTPDWVNYILMSKWAAANTPKNTFIASRKPDISFIYSERKFFGITKVPTITPDSMVRLISDSMVYVGIQMEKLMQNPLYQNPSFREKIVGFVNGNFKFVSNAPKPELVGIFRFKPSELQAWEQQIKQTGVLYEKNIKQWLKDLKLQSQDFAICSPDQLLEVFRKNNVKYVLLASLRAYPAEKTGNIIDTMHRFVYYIQLKYPNLFKMIQQIGGQDDEPAQLWEIMY